jgi:polyhydroxybutyrate depolymerase
LRPSRRAALLLCAALLAVLGVPASANPGSGISTIIGTPYDGKLRTFNLYVPPRVPTRKPVPLLLVLHGLFIDPATQEASSGLDAVADKEDVAVAYPAGLDGSWNAGTCCGPSATRRVDDVGFLAHVVQLVAQVRPIDLNRVYITGFSNGGMMALRAACERPDVFAAAAAVAATLQVPCRGRTAVSALLLNGQQDKTVPYTGATYSRFLHTPLTPVATAARRLAVRSGCDAVRTTSSYRYSTRTYRGCGRGSALTVITAPRLGHHWPEMTKDRVDGEELVWSFLSHRRRQPGR